jgi:hypothetical protein
MLPDFDQAVFVVPDIGVCAVCDHVAVWIIGIALVLGHKGDALGGAASGGITIFIALPSPMSTMLPPKRLSLSLPMKTEI